MQTRSRFGGLGRGLDSFRKRMSLALPGNANPSCADRYLHNTCAFMRSPGAAYTRNQVMESVWGTNVYVEERTIDVHISCQDLGEPGSVSVMGLHTGLTSCS